MPGAQPEERVYWEHRGPRDWRPVRVTTRFGSLRDLPPPAFPDVRTRPAPPRNVALRRPDGTGNVVPVRTLRRADPNATRAPEQGG